MILETETNGRVRLISDVLILVSYGDAFAVYKYRKNPPTRILDPSAYCYLQLHGNDEAEKGKRREWNINVYVDDQIDNKDNKENDAEAGSEPQRGRRAKGRPAGPLSWKAPGQAAEQTSQVSSSRQ